MRNDEINNYRKALVELEAVINTLDENEYKKIPQKLIHAISENKDENYIYQYNKDLRYEEWSFMPETKDLLYNILKKYLLTEEEKQHLKEKERLAEIQIEKEKRQKYNPDNIFKDNKNIVEKYESKKEETKIEVVQERKWYKRIFYAIKKLLKK